MTPRKHDGERQGERRRAEGGEREGRRGREGGGGLYLAWRKKERSQRLSAAVIALN